MWQTGLQFISFPHNPDFLTTLKKKAFEYIVGKEENAGNQHFLVFPQCFLSFPEQILAFGSPLWFANAIN